MKLPLRVTIITAFTIVTATIISMIAALNYMGNREAILENARVSISSAVELAELGVNQLVERAVRSIDTAAHLPHVIFDSQNPEPLLVTLSASLRNHPQFYSMFVGFPDGAFVQTINMIGPGGNLRKVLGIPETATLAWRIIGPVADGRGRPETWQYFDKDGNELLETSPQVNDHVQYDPRTHSWFIESQRKQGIEISDVSILSSLKKPSITVSEAVYHQPSLSIGVYIALDDLADLTKKLRPGENGVVAVINNNGDIISHLSPEKPLRKSDYGTIEGVSASEIEYSLIREAFGRLDMGKGSEATFKIDDKEYVSFFKPASTNYLGDWNIISVAAVDDFTGQLMATLQHSLIIAGFVMLVAVGCMAIMAGWIARPILQLRNMSDQITKLNFSTIDDFATPFDEINKLRLSMFQMKDALDRFLRFIPREVARELILSGQSGTIGGVKREVTMLFTDVEAFTSMTERMTPEEIMSQISEYFENLSFCIQTNSGTIDKYIGDSIMAIWNAPAEDSNHADNACRGMLTAYHVSEDLNKKFIENGQAPMSTRFGLHCGEVLVGNVGASDRMQYTCLGSNVNLAARIEGLNKFYGTQLLVSDTVRRKATSEFLFRRVDIVEVKGTTLPLTIYELMGERDKDAAFYVGKDALKMASRYEQAFDFYLHRDFSDALYILGQLDEDHPNDPVIALLTKKCEGFIANPPPSNWNGATALDEK